MEENQGSAETGQAPRPGSGQAGGLKARVDEALERIRPYIQMDAGNVELVNVNEEDGIVFIRFQGSCQGCPSSMMTLQMGIENELRSSVPEIKQVIPV